MPDHPRNVAKIGYKDAFHYTTVWKGKTVIKNISALAYKSGTGNAVALSLSTVDTGSHWDLIPNDDCNHKWYFSTSLTDEERKMKGFRLIIGPKRYAVELLLLTKVEPRTCGPEGQGSREWFVDRMFSGTSSTAHAIFKKAVPVLVKENDDEVMQALELVLSYTGEKNLIEKIQADQQQQADEDNNDSNQESGEDEQDKDKEEAEEWIEKLSSSKDHDEDFKTALEDASITGRTADWIISLTYDTPFKELTAANAKKKLTSCWEGQTKQQLVHTNVCQKILYKKLFERKTLHFITATTKLRSSRKFLILFFHPKHLPTMKNWLH